MKIVRTVDELKKELKKLRDKSIGFVPTMGFLHEGHLSLVAECRKQMDVSVVSIFVNPTQFAPGEDFESYPRDEKRDLDMLEGAGVDIVFLPSVEEIYPEGNSTDITIKSELTKKLCGKTRPTHFNGVTNVVGRFFCMVKPDKAFFGRKDAQQLAIITKLAREMRIGTEIVGCPIVREKDGLAMSSRNTYLSEEERKNALSISSSLMNVEKMVGTLSVDEAKASVRERIENANGKVDYIEIVDPFTLEDVKDFSGDYMVAVAAYFGKTRLLDNRARINGVCI